MNLESLFQQFLREKRYLKNLSSHTIECYERAFKQFNLQEPNTKSQTSMRVAEISESGKSDACVDAHTRGRNPFITWLLENDFMSKRPSAENERGGTLLPPLTKSMGLSASRRQPQSLLATHRHLRCNLI
jgi:hypothetical protein